MTEPANPSPSPRNGARAAAESPLVRGSAVLGGGRFAAAALSAVWLIIAARRLSVDAFGNLAVLLAIGAMVSAMSDLGYPFLLSHEVGAAGRVSRSTMRFVVGQRLRVGFVTAVVGSLAYLLVADGDNLAVVVLFSVSLMCTIVYSSLSAALRGLHVFRFEAANEVVSRSFVLVVGWALLASGGGLVAAVAVYAVADLGSMLVLGVITRRHVDVQDDGIDRSRLRMRSNLHLSAGRGLGALYARADTWLVALLQGSHGAALYGAPYRLLDGFLLIPRSIGAVAVPHLARAEEEDASIRRIAAVSAGLAALFAIPVALFARPILVTLFGERYAGATTILVLLAASAVPGAVVTTVLPYLGLRRHRPIFWLMLTILTVNVGLNVVAITAFGTVGAAGVNLVTQSLLALALVGMLRARRRQTMSSIRSRATRAHAAVSSSTTI